MSIDTYFCFCCLSTDDLLPLYGFNTDENYAELLTELFSIEPFREDYEDDSYVCSKCALRIKDFQQFERQLRATITILQANGLINTEIKGNQKIVRKATSSNLEDNKKCLVDNDVTNVKDITDTVQQRDSKHAPIKAENGIEILREHQSTMVPSKEGIKEEQDEELECQECQQKLPNMYMYHKHMNTHFPNFICDTCGNGFLTEKKLKRHITTHNLGPFVCEVCDAEFNNYNTFISHRQRKHNPNDTKTTKMQKTGNYTCSICEKKFTKYGSLYTHMRSLHKKHKRYFCCVCADGFYNKQDLYAHENTHTRANMFQCVHCDKSYLRKKALKVHMRKHTDERRFSCAVCGKGFIQKCTLTKHLTTHNNEAQS